MSYDPVKKDDDLNEVFSQILDSVLISKHMNECKNDIDSFIHWFHKAMKISKRDALIYVKNNMNNFNSEIQDYVKQFIRERPSKEDILE